MRGVHGDGAFPGVLHGLSLAFAMNRALNHERHHRLLGRCTLLALLTRLPPTAAPPTATAPAPAATAAWLLAARLTMCLTMHGLAASLQGFLFVFALLVLRVL